MSDYLDSLVRQAVAAMHDLRFQEALHLWSEAYAVAPNDCFQIHKAMCWRHLGAADKALALLKPLMRHSPYPALAGAIAAQCSCDKGEPRRAGQYLHQSLGLWQYEGASAPQYIETAQELMLAAGRLGQHTTVTKILRATPGVSPTVILQGATAFFNRGFFGEAQRLWNRLDPTMTRPFMAVAQWIIEGTVPPFQLEYDFDWAPFVGRVTDEAITRTLQQRPLAGVVRLQLVYQMLRSDTPAHQHWDAALLLFADTSPWQSQLAQQLLAVPWLEQPLRKRILQQLVANGQFSLNQELQWWEYGGAVKVTPASLHVLTKQQCIDHTVAALNCMLIGKEVQALNLLEKAHRWLPGDSVIGLALVECLHILGETPRAKGLLRLLGQYWCGDETFHRDAALVAEFVDDKSMREYHIASLGQLRGSPSQPQLH